MEMKDLTPEQKEKFKSCETSQDIIRLAESEGIKLTDEQLDRISGGGGTTWSPCTWDTGYN